MALSGKTVVSRQNCSITNCTEEYERVHLLHELVKSVIKWLMFSVFLNKRLRVCIYYNRQKYSLCCSNTSI